MSRDDPRKDVLHGPWPTAAEMLQARFCDRWEIWRDLLLGHSHGDWIAKRLLGKDAPEAQGESLRAATVEGLEELIHKAEATQALQNLRDELAGRGWKTRLAGDALYVRNPACDLNDTITCESGTFRYSWGQGIGPVDDVPGAAERIMYVLQAVAE
jgi:hypothetical protein